MRYKKSILCFITFLLLGCGVEVSKEDYAAVKKEYDNLYKVNKKEYDEIVFHMRNTISLYPSDSLLCKLENNQREERLNYYFNEKSLLYSGYTYHAFSEQEKISKQNFDKLGIQYLYVLPHRKIILIKPFKPYSESYILYLAYCSDSIVLKTDPIISFDSENDILSKISENVFLLGKYDE